MSTEMRPFPRAKIKWPVLVKTDESSIDGVTLNLCPDGVFISCPLPLRLNAIFDMVISTPSAERTIEATAEVVWSNRYGPDDEIMPRGMGTRFTDISHEDRRFIAKITLAHLKSENVAPDLLKRLDTLTIEPQQT